MAESGGRKIAYYMKYILRNERVFHIAKEEVGKRVMVGQHSEETIKNIRRREEKAGCFYLHPINKNSRMGTT